MANIQKHFSFFALCACAFFALAACPNDPTEQPDPQPQTAATPTASPAGGTYNTAQSVSLSSATANAQIRYTTNGTDPTATSTLYSSPIAINQTTTLKAIAVREGMNTSGIMTEVYTITGGQPQTAAPPTASPTGGTFNTAQSVTLSSTTANAQIR